MVVFPDWQALGRNTTGEALARALYARYAGTCGLPCRIFWAR